MNNGTIVQLHRCAHNVAVHTMLQCTPHTAVAVSSARQTQQRAVHAKHSSVQSVSRALQRSAVQSQCSAVECAVHATEDTSIRQSRVNCVVN